MKDFYNREYYKDGCGADYSDSQGYSNCFAKIAEAIVEKYNPNTFLDVGCAYGYLVKELRDRGVEAYGIDDSEYTISQAAEEIQGFVRAINPLKDELPKEFPSSFDCIASIEVIEHLTEEEAQPFIHFLCSYTDIVLFSSSPDDIIETANRNVQQPEYWAKRFASEGFYRDVFSEGVLISHHEMTFLRKNMDEVKLVENYEHKLRLLDYEIKKIQKEYSNIITDNNEAMSVIKARENDLNSIVDELKRELSEREEQKKAEFEKQREFYKEEIESIKRNSDTKLRYEEFQKNALVNVNKSKDILIESLRVDNEKLSQRENDLWNSIIGLRNSTSWKISYPIRFVARLCKRVLKKEQIPLRDTYSLIMKDNDSLRSERKRLKLESNQNINDILSRINYDEDCRTNNDIFDETSNLPIEKEPWYFVTKPLKTMTVKSDEYRINLVTDSISNDSVFGGVVTALVIVSRFCKKYDYPLRIITRDGESNPVGYRKLMGMMEVDIPDDVSYFWDNMMSGENDEKSLLLDVGEKDIFVATSWWSAMACKAMSLNNHTFCVLQEMETCFYPMGDKSLMCRRIIEDKSVNFIVNHYILWDFFKEYYHNNCENVICFEPTLHSSISNNNNSDNNRHVLFFDARPNNPSDLFHVGLEMINTAFSNGILDAGEWDVVLIGKDIPYDIRFIGGITPIVFESMDWQIYIEFLSRVDLILSLMYTTQPSYLPYDVISSGRVVLTNSYNSKKELGNENIIIGDILDKENFLKCFSEAVELSKNTERSRLNHENIGIQQDWNKTTEHVIDWMKEVGEIA